MTVLGPVTAAMSLSDSVTMPANNVTTETILANVTRKTSTTTTAHQVTHQPSSTILSPVDITTGADVGLTEVDSKIPGQMITTRLTSPQHHINSTITTTPQNMGTATVPSRGEGRGGWENNNGTDIYNNVRYVTRETPLYVILPCVVILGAPVLWVIYVVIKSLITCRKVNSVTPDTSRTLDARSTASHAYSEMGYESGEKNAGKGRRPADYKSNRTSRARHEVDNDDDVDDDDVKNGTDEEDEEVDSSSVKATSGKAKKNLHGGRMKDFAGNIVK